MCTYQYLSSDTYKKSPRITSSVYKWCLKENKTNSQETKTKKCTSSYNVTLFTRRPQHKIKTSTQNQSREKIEKQMGGGHTTE
uniref:Uncharacterized protein n=1 Tax=Arion vulgaris TaxID=1028688 RepID=A0A0B6Z741_9EUPU